MLSLRAVDAVAPCAELRTAKGHGAQLQVVKKAGQHRILRTLPQRVMETVVHQRIVRLFVLTVFNYTGKVLPLDLTHPERGEADDQCFNLSHRFEDLTQERRLHAPDHDCARWQFRPSSIRS